MRADLVLAPNPGLFTGPGTNTWVVSDQGESIVIDPGPVIDSHLDSIVRQIGSSQPLAVLVTHTHPDHAPAANRLAAELGVPAIGRAEGPDFSPDREIADGDRVPFGGTAAVCVATPGHTPDSVCFRVDDALFSGDHIMGGSTVVIEDLADYLESLRRLEGIGLEVIHPGHGPVLDGPDAVIAEYLAHRLERERQILEALEGGSSTVGEIVTRVYRDVDPALHPAAAVSVGAHLRKLRDEGRVVYSADPTWGTPVAVAT